ncbi:MAG: peptidoglycan bridge formation glycyltransferase FemA/FemB family protein [Spirochaetaceae bacterium]
MLTVTPIKREELGNHQALFYGSNFMQTQFWAELKEEYGFKPYFFAVTVAGSVQGLVVMLRPIFKGLSLAYIPHGPSQDISTTENLTELSKSLKQYLPKGTLLIRYDLLAGTVGDVYPKPLKGLSKSTVDIQVPDTTILDLSGTEDELLAKMHKKTRYNIKLAGKKAVTIREANISELDAWYHMYKITAKRDSIAIHSKDYYQSVYTRAKDSEHVDMKLFFAEYEGELLAGIFVMICGDSATYLYGASSNNKRNLMPAYLLQWQAIQTVKSLGCKSYDFCGIPPVNDKDHPMYGLYRFKTGFGGEIIHRLGCYDYNLSALAGLFNFVEKLRNFYYKKLRKR